MENWNSDNVVGAGKKIYYEFVLDKQPVLIENSNEWKILSDKNFKKIICDYCNEMDVDLISYDSFLFTRIKVYCNDYEYIKMITFFEQLERYVKIINYRKC